MKLPVEVFSAKFEASKATSKDLLVLLKLPENVGLDGKYERLAPVLFTDPYDISANMLFKSEILLNVSCCVLFL